MTRAAFVIPGDLSLPTGGYAYDRHVLARASVHGLDLVHVALPGSYPAPAADDLAATERILAALEPSIVLLIDGLAFGAMPGDLVGRIRQKIVALVHHPLCLEAGLTPMRQRFLRQTETMALAFAEATIVTSPATARIVAADFGVAPQRLTVAEPGTERAARARGTGQPVHVLAVGSIVPRKAYDVLARALLHVDPGTDWHLTIVGAVRDEAAHATLVAALAVPDATGRPLARRVTVTGAVDDRALADLYDRADLFVLPSHYEGYGMVLTEALVRGLPIVTTDGVAAALPLSHAVRIVPAGDATALGTVLSEVITDASVRRCLADASIAAAQTLPTWDDTTRIIASVLKRVAA